MSWREFDVVVGGSGALGSAVLTLLSERADAELIATYRSADPPNELRQKAQWIRYNSESKQGLAELRAAVEGRGVAHLLFAVGEPSSKREIVNTESEEWERLWRSNVLSFLDVYGALYRAVRRSQGRVLVVSSDTTRKLGVRNGPYSATKAALEAIAVTLAREEAPYGVRVNVLAPSLFDSPLAEHVLRMKGVTDLDAYRKSLPWKRALSLGEVAKVAFSILTGEEWCYASGQIYRLAVE